MNIEQLLKAYYSVGAMLYSVALTGTIGIVWAVCITIVPAARANGVGLLLSAVITFGVAYVVPEPPNSPDAGRKRLTHEEAFTAAVGTFLNFAVVLGARCAFSGV